MNEFFSERTIKKTKKSDHCLGCGKWVSAGIPAAYLAMKDEGQFFDAYYHVDCRKAEIALNELHGTWGDEYSPLYMIHDGDEGDIAWLKREWPSVADRMAL